jgi:hypothetical protein
MNDSRKRCLREIDGDALKTSLRWPEDKTKDIGSVAEFAGQFKKIGN